MTPEDMSAYTDDAAARDHVARLFGEHFPQAAPVAQGFAGICRIERHPKGAVLKKTGESEDSISIVLAGSAGVFVSRTVREVCLDLSLEGDFLAEYESFITGRPSEGYTKTLEPSLLARIPISSPECTAIPGFDEVLRTSLIYMFADRQSRLVSLLTESPEQRYRRLIRRNPRFAREVSTTVLASWLGVSREHLSRIRAKI